MHAIKPPAVLEPYLAKYRVPALFRRYRSRLVAGIEQVLSALISMVGVIILSRIMTVDDFGIVATGFGIWLIVEMLQHSLTINPFILCCPRPDQDSPALGTWLLWNLLVTIAIAAFFSLAGLLLQPYFDTLGQALLLGAPISLAGMLYMFARRVHYHRHHRMRMLLQTLFYGAAYLTTLLLVTSYTSEMTPFWGAVILTMAYLVPGIIFTILIAFDAALDRLFLERVKDARRLILHLGAADSLWQFSYGGALIALSVLSTPAALAVFSITRTLVRPIALIISTLIQVDFSRVSRALTVGSTSEFKRIILDFRNTLILCTAIPIALLLIFPGFFLSLVYGEQYAEATLEMRLRVLLFLPMIMAAPYDIGLIALRDTRYLIYAHSLSLLGGVLFLAGCWLFYEVNAATALGSLIIARIISVLLLYPRYRQVVSGQKVTFLEPTLQTEGQYEASANK